MKKIHPQYYPKAEIHCACGHSIKIGSTREKMEVEICSACHPFYTGKKKLVDSAGRVDRFKQRMEKANQLKKALKETSAQSKQKKEASQKVEKGKK